MNLESDERWRVWIEFVGSEDEDEMNREPAEGEDDDDDQDHLDHPLLVLDALCRSSATWEGSKEAKISNKITSYRHRNHAFWSLPTVWPVKSPQMSIVKSCPKMISIEELKI